MADDIVPRATIDDIRARCSQSITEIAANPREYRRVQQILSDRIALLAHYDALRARVAAAERLLQMAASVCDNGAFMLATEIREWLAGNKEESRNA